MHSTSPRVLLRTRLTETINQSEAQPLDPNRTPEYRRITITLDAAEADIVRQRCQDYDIGPTQMFRTFLRLELRFGLLRKEVVDRLKQAPW